MLRTILLAGGLSVASMMMAGAQNCCADDTVVREIQFPLTAADTNPVFCYFNDEWLALPDYDVVHTDSIQKMEVKNDEYGNRALFFTVSPEYLAQLKSDIRKKGLINLDPRCEFPGGNGKFKEWLDENKRVPEGYKGSEKVVVEVYIEPDGSVTQPKIVRASKNEAANAEALRLVNALPKFRVQYSTPKKSRLCYLIPITFKEPGAVFIRGDQKQGQTSFKLTKEHGHYYTTATINGHENTPVFIETGFPGMTMSVEMYDSILASLPLEEVRNDDRDWLRGDRGKHRIVKRLKGKVPVGDLTFEGLVLVVEPYNDKVTLPANLLKNESDTAACLIRFDFKKNTLDYIRREDVDLEKMHTYTLVKYDPVPVFTSTLELSDTMGHHLEMSGDFAFDLGCGTSVFFFRKTMMPVLKENKFTIQEASDKQGNIVGQGLYAGYCRIGDKSKTGFSIGITNRISRYDELGCVGPSFFGKNAVILDRENGVIYY